jgi:hypothetical protein
MLLRTKERRVKLYDAVWKEWKWREERKEWKW